VTDHIVMFSGGAGSWAAGKKAKERALPGERVVLLFSDTLMEDEDLYRFLPEASANIGAELVVVTEGRDPWQVFHDVKFLGNTMADPCSRILKRQFLRTWLDENCAPDNTIVYLGIDWTEEHRFSKSQRYWAPWVTCAPLCEEPMDKGQVLEWLAAEGIRQPRLYDMGFAHNNCGGFCIKAGQAQFRRLLHAMPERYAYHEEQEQKLRAHLGKDVAILRDRRGGVTKPFTLRDFRLQVQETDEFDDDWGGCACFTPGEED